MIGRIDRTLAMPRTWMEHFARRKTFWRKLPADLGSTRILVSPEARLQHLKWGNSAFDPTLLRLAREMVQEDSVVWDIGANIGVFSLAAATRAKRGYVLAVEPDPWLFSLLNKSCNHPGNRTLSLDPICAAISDQPGVARLAIAERGRASNYLEQFGGRSQAGGIRQRQLVPVLTLDLLAENTRPPTIIKIDVEGAERAVLMGARNLLREVRPILFVEVGEGTRVDVIELLDSSGYQSCSGGHGVEWPPSSDLLAVPT